MGATVDIGVVGTVILADLIDHLVGLLRSGAIVEPHHIVTVHLLLQSRYRLLVRQLVDLCIDVVDVGLIICTTRCEADYSSEE